ncbi:capsular biosynthesis protein, partial [Escherichia coli]
DMKLFKKFRGYLLVKTQVNAVYYGGNTKKNANIIHIKFQVNIF